ncbi:hypothetical protein IT570_04760 [Candidatus Sumerlaeota bacterium]|nr:hypothetical protein [Candidatus Sumerlaeota bacterium]
MLLAIAAISSLVSFACAIYVGIQIYKEKGIVHALIAIICCQLYGFVWGWSSWQDSRKMQVMLIWTICILISLALNIMGAMQGQSISGGYTPTP